MPRGRHGNQIIMTSQVRRFRSFLPMGLLNAAVVTVCLAQDAGVPAARPRVPLWAQPGSASHAQVAPPAGFHRASRNFQIPIGMFEGQSDIGAPIEDGSATYNAATGEYTIHSAGYNIWYTRDEFRYLWRKMSGDVSLACSVRFPDPTGYGDRKAALVIRQDLTDDAPEAIVALHGTGMIQLAERPARGVRVRDIEYRIGGRGTGGGATPDSLVTVTAKRIGIEKRGDRFALYVSVDGEPMHQFGPPIELRFKEPFYVGIGFCSHVPDKIDSALLSGVVLENSAGKVR